MLGQFQVAALDQQSFETPQPFAGHHGPSARSCPTRTTMPAMPEALSLTPARRMACPRCQSPMADLRLSAHRGGAVTVEHCAGCRLVWFDQLESVALDGLGWIHLLRELDLGAQRPLSEPSVAAPGCPRCQTALRAVQNQTRFGSFAVQACPQGHGHLHSHSGLLAERGLVRPLGLVERKALAAERHAIHCLNCGGPARASDERCSFCKTALLVLDVPRLLHSLQARSEAEGPSPLAMGQHAVWACRGCGAALNPARETACRQCGHLVVAQGLPDIAPLLAAAEAAWQQVAAKAAQLAARYPSSQRPQPATPPRVLREGPGPQRNARAGWVGLALMGLLAIASLGLVQADAPWPQRNLQEDWAAQPLSPQPGADWAWLWAHERIWPDARPERAVLQRKLFELHMRLAGGASLPPAATLGGYLDGSQYLRGGGGQEAESRWNTLLSAELRVVFDHDQRPPPPEDPPQGGWRNFDTGLWTDADAYRAVWDLRVRNTGPWPRTVSALTLDVPIRSPDTVRWECKPLDKAPSALPPQGELQLRCTSRVAPIHLGLRWQDMLTQLRDRDTSSWRWRDEGLRQAKVFNLSTQGLAERAAGQSAALAGFLKRHALPAPPTTAPLPLPLNPSATAAPVRNMAQRWAQVPRVHRPFLAAGSVLGVLAAFFALGQALGTRWALGAWMAVAGTACLLLGRGEGAASVLWVGAGWVLCYLTGLGLSFGFRIYRDALFHMGSAADR